MTRLMPAGAGLVAAVVAALFAIAALGDERDGDKPLATVTVATHPAAGPPPKTGARLKAGSLFKVFYRETDPLSIPAGTTPYRLRACPRGGAVLSSWHVRLGQDKSGLLASGSTPAGVREVDYVVTNTTGGAVNGRLGLICIK